MAAAMWGTSGPSPRTQPTSMYWGSSVVQNDTSDMSQPCSSRLPCSMSQAIRTMLAPSELTG